MTLYCEVGQGAEGLAVAVEQSLSNAREDLEDAGTDQARAAAERQIAVGEAKLQALGS